MLFKRGKRVFSPALTLIYYPSAEIRMGIVVSKKFGNAVLRNRIKRLVRAAFSANCGLLLKNYSFLVLPKIAEEYSFGAFEKSMVTCFKKVNSCESSK